MEEGVPNVVQDRGFPKGGNEMELILIRFSVFRTLMPEVILSLYLFINCNMCIFDSSRSFNDLHLSDWYGLLFSKSATKYH